MIPATVKAGILALEERMRGYTSVILFPKMVFWSEQAKELARVMGQPNTLHNPYTIQMPFDGIYIRYSSNRCSLLSLRVDTLVVVEPRLCDEDGLAKAVNHLLFMSHHQVVYHVFEDGKHERWEI
jgi:hypothetical protein